MKLYLPKELFEVAESLMCEVSKGCDYSSMNNKQKLVADYAKEQGVLLYTIEGDSEVFDKSYNFDETDEYFHFAISGDTELVEFKKLEFSGDTATLANISELLDMINSGQIDESTLTIQCDNDSTNFSCTDKRYSEFFEDQEDEAFIRIKIGSNGSNGGYATRDSSNIVEFYDLLFPKADVGWV